MSEATKPFRRLLDRAKTLKRAAGSPGVLGEAAHAGSTHRHRKSARLDCYLSLYFFLFSLLFLFLYVCVGSQEQSSYSLQPAPLSSIVYNHDIGWCI